MSEETIGQYGCLRKIGEGGVGEVFEGLDPMLGRRVALKRLRPELASRQEVVERFRSEAQTLAQLNHPHIATLYSFERDGDVLFMVMEYVEGETVAAMLKRGGALPLAAALALFVQALDGIGYAHERGIVHRDIKASNLIQTPDGVVKVMDFGIARVLGSERMTLMGQLVGTPEYMSPEQVRGEETDARADIYALGALFYALLTGTVPFRAGSDFDLMRAHLESAPMPLVGRVPGVDEELEAIIFRALEKDPAARFQTTAEFRTALDPILAATALLDDAAGAENDDDTEATPSPPSSAEPTRVIAELEILPAADDPLDDAPTAVLERPALPRGSLGLVRAAVWSAAAGLLALNVLWVDADGTREAASRAAAPPTLALAEADGAPLPLEPRERAGTATAGALETPLIPERRIAESNGAEARRKATPRASRSSSVEGRRTQWVIRRQ
ncbi:MAG: protein kinase [Proteobacteria bacterium]|nr:protein kinase [Pseudomonadota bacterium]